MHFTKFSILRFSKRYSFNNFHLSSKLDSKYHNQGLTYRLLFFGDLPTITKKYGTLNFFLTQDHIELEVSKCYFFYSFNQVWSKLYGDIAYHGGMQTITFLGNRPIYKKIVALRNFNMGVNGKMLRCGIS